VALRYEQDLSFEEIGQVLGVPEVTARSYVHRARKSLAQALSGWQPLKTR
jgi:DNA-directed RNA polymerase specialized sigma24 family protein